MPPRKQKAEKSSAGNCQWSREDEATLVNVLKDYKDMGFWGDNNPRKPTWTASEQALLGSEVKSGGSPKTVNAIKNRWQRLKKEYVIVKELRSQSGWSWDLITNLPKIEHDVWEAYIADHPNAKPYRTKEFPLFDDIAELVDGTHANGNNAYRGGDSTTLDDEFGNNEDSTEVPMQSSFVQESTQTQSFSIQDSNTTQSSSTNHTGGTQSSNKGKKRVDIEEDNIVDENIDPVLDLDPDVRPENLKRQRSKSAASTATTGNERRKARRVSNNQSTSALEGSMANAIREVKETMLETTSRVGPSTCSSSAQSSGPNMAAIISAIDNNDDFSDNEKLDAYKVIKFNPRTGEMFASMTISHLQTKFLRDEINELRANVYGIGN